MLLKHQNQNLHLSSSHVYIVLFKDLEVFNIKNNLAIFFNLMLEIKGFPYFKKMKKDKC